MASLTLTAPGQSIEIADRCPFFGGEFSDWSALQPTEKAEVILAAYQERLLPGLRRIEKMITRLALEHGLEYGRLDELAVVFLDVARQTRDRAEIWRRFLVAPAGEAMAGEELVSELVVGNTAISRPIERLSALIGNDADHFEDAPCYCKLIRVLRSSQRELAELLMLESEFVR